MYHSLKLQRLQIFFSCVSCVFFSFTYNRFCRVLLNWTRYFACKRRFPACMACTYNTQSFSVCNFLSSIYHSSIPFIVPVSILVCHRVKYILRGQCYIAVNSLARTDIRLYRAHHCYRLSLKSKLLNES